MPADVLLERMRGADRQTYDTLLRYRDAQQVATANPTTDNLRALLRALETHLAAIEGEARVLTEAAEEAARLRVAIEGRIRALGESPERPPMPSSVMAFGPVLSGEYDAKELLPLRAAPAPRPTLPTRLSDRAQVEARLTELDTQRKFRVRGR